MHTAEEAASKLGISADGLRKAIRRGTIPAKKFGKMWVVDDQTIDYYAQNIRGQNGPKGLDKFDNEDK